MANERSRREILMASAVLAGGAGAALISSCGGGSKTEPPQTVNSGQMENDAAIAATLLELEGLAVVGARVAAALVRRIVACVRDQLVVVRP